jgi:putative transcriptional regulator
MYHYIECGLSNVYLASGYNVEETSGYGETLSVEDILGLHRAIGDSLVRQHRTMNGAEFRFLRIELDISQRALAESLSTNEKSIAKWEKAFDKPVSNRSAERLLRIVYANKKKDQELERLIETITESDQSFDVEQIQLRLEADGWHTAIAA